MRTEELSPDLPLLLPFSLLLLTVLPMEWYYPVAQEARGLALLPPGLTGMDEQNSTYTKTIERDH